MTSKTDLLACPFCGAKGEIRLHHYHGTGASGMETPEPFAACSHGCVVMSPVRCDDWPWGRQHGLLTSEQARQVAIDRWNKRVTLDT
jgi:hypothetical protein